ncbi:MAG: apolipoprotein N-acyltransferase [Victivallaceae bacterium]|nr:apolipoprotein N-acyltransferase [Victivallaceae bacterium]
MNERRRISFVLLLLRFAIAGVSGLVLSAALPPLNQSALAFLAFVPLLIITMHCSRGGAFWYGFGFGWAWAFTAFNFLREIQGSFGVIPYILATILALYFGVFGLCCFWFGRYLRRGRDVRMLTFSERKENPSDPGFGRELVYVLAVSAAYLILEWGRAWVLPWNYLAVTQYRNPALLQLAAWGGTYLVGFPIIFCNAAFATVLDSVWSRCRAGRPRRRPYVLLLAALLLVADGWFGAWRVTRYSAGETAACRIGLVQCNLSQRRSATFGEVVESVDVNFGLGFILAARTDKPELVMMPESATPISYSEDSQISTDLRLVIYDFVRRGGIPLLYGAVDTDVEGRSFNRAMLFTPDHAAGYVEKYDKIQRVPFGEYVPFRSVLPEFVVRIIDMNRDLTPGSDFTPLNLLPGVRAGMSICFEDVFPYIARREAQLGANLLAVITNDAWYPESSEPEQHFANCVMRTVETGLPMVRCGNNSSSLVLDPVGRVADGVMHRADGSVDPIGKSRAAGVVTVNVPSAPAETFHTRYGDWFVYLMLAVFVGALGCCFAGWYGDRRYFLKQLDIQI